MSKWDPERYLQFKNQRTQPAVDLAMRVKKYNPKSIVDLGCGPGNSTDVLHKCFKESKIIGIDNSKEMIDKAKSNYPDLKFEVCSATDITDKYDMIFSNACIQWIPEHHRLLPKLFDNLNKNGVLAIQIPINAEEPLLKIMDETVREEKWGFNETLIETNATLLPEEYFDILSSLTNEFDIWETVYYHKMPSVDSMVDWIKGTRLRPYINALDEKTADKLVTRITEDAKAIYKVQRNGEFIFRFRRLFMTAVKLGD